MTFEWDETKAISNALKHDVDFDEATAVFEDPARIVEDVTKPEYGEARFKVIGKMGDMLIAAVIYTDREERIRIISARRANKREREKYYSSQES